MMSSTLTAVTLRTGTHSDAWPGVSASADSFKEQLLRTSASSGPYGSSQSLLKLMHIGDLGARNPEQISGGQRQGVALACALAIEPSSAARTRSRMSRGEGGGGVAASKLYRRIENGRLHARLVDSVMQDLSSRSVGNLRGVPLVGE